MYERCAKANPKIVDDFGAAELEDLSQKIFTAVNLGIPPSKNGPTTPDPADPATPDKLRGTPDRKEEKDLDPTTPEVADRGTPVVERGESGA